mmetsp:Transcript_1202/g.4942  ORF Transcript_1202/g.4942 Transcript_1202/m.4942 type:complete len:430 (+) Transcript_1202:2081-3370(+)
MWIGPLVRRQLVRVDLCLVGIQALHARIPDDHFLDDLADDIKLPLVDDEDNPPEALESAIETVRGLLVKLLMKCPNSRSGVFGTIRLHLCCRSQLPLIVLGMHSLLAPRPHQLRAARERHLRAEGQLPRHAVLSRRRLVHLGRRRHEDVAFLAMLLLMRCPMILALPVLLLLHRPHVREGHGQARAKGDHAATGMVVSRVLSLVERRPLRHQPDALLGVHQPLRGQAILHGLRARALLVAAIREDLRAQVHLQAPRLEEGPELKSSNAMRMRLPLHRLAVAAVAVQEDVELRAAELRWPALSADLLADAIRLRRSHIPIVDLDDEALVLEPLADHVRGREAQEPHHGLGEARGGVVGPGDGAQVRELVGQGGGHSAELRVDLQMDILILVRQPRLVRQTAHRLHGEADRHEFVQHLSAQDRNVRGDINV